MRTESTVTRNIHLPAALFGARDHIFGLIAAKMPIKYSHGLHFSTIIKSSEWTGHEPEDSSLSRHGHQLA
jgi:hypothetical protein